MNTAHYLGPLLLIVSSTAFANDCDNPKVSFGEVMSGLQAGFTGGAANENTQPYGFYAGVSGIDQRGFVDPESGTGWKCDGDWGLVTAWLGTGYGPNRTRKVARELAESFILNVRIEVDGVDSNVSGHLH